MVYPPYSAYRAYRAYWAYKSAGANYCAPTGLQISADSAKAG